MATKVKFRTLKDLCPCMSSFLSFLINCLCLRGPETSLAGGGVIRFATWRKNQRGPDGRQERWLGAASAVVVGDKGLKTAVAIRREKSTQASTIYVVETKDWDRRHWPIRGHVPATPQAYLSTNAIST